MDDFCKNCGNLLDDEEKYCRECGTKRDEDKYEPSIEKLQIVYASPYEFNGGTECAFKTVCCDKCGLIFIGDFNSNNIFCPECNAEAQKDVFEKENDQTVCGNCGSLLDDEEKYCRECGTKRGNGKYEPSIIDIQDIYAPPFEMK